MISITEGLQSASILIALASVGIGVYLLLFTRTEMALQAQRHVRRGQLKGFLFAAINTKLGVSSQHLPRLDQRQDPLVCLEMMLDLLRGVDGIDLRPALRAYVVWGQLPELIQLALQGSAADRVKAMALMGHLEDSDTEAALLQCLGSDDLSLRMAAVRALAQRGAREHIGRALRAMCDCGSQGSDRLFADALMRFGPDVAGTLVAWQERLADKPVVLAATLLALAEWGYESAEQCLRQALDHPSPIVRRASLTAMARLTMTPSLEQLPFLVQDPDVGVRRRCTELLGGGHALFIALCQLADDADPDVSMAALVALGRHGTQGPTYLAARAAVSDDRLAPQCLEALAEANSHHPAVLASSTGE